MITRLSPDAWRGMSEDIHRVVFGTVKPADEERIDFALMVSRPEDGGKPMGYITCREISANVVYWQFGGSFPGTIGTVKTFQGYREFVDYCRERYQKIFTYVDNKNVVMLKMAMKAGFRITGVRALTNETLVELYFDCRKGD